jgi:hypothetical protein
MSSGETGSGQPRVVSTASSNNTLAGSNDPLNVSSSNYLLEDVKLKEILLSDVGTEALLARLKQSSSSAKELSVYVKKTAMVEGDNIASVRKLARLTREALKKPDTRQGTYARQVDELVKLNERSCDVSNSFVAALHIMHDELSELSKAIEKSRKSVKETSLRQEKSLSEAEQASEKAKSKYDSLCEEFERMRTGDPTKTKFGFKHARTPQHEEELHKKVMAAESEYQLRVDGAQNLRRELITKSRPATVKQLKDLILECDAAMSLQLQKYANLHETLALNRGFIVAPLRPKGAANASLTMKELAAKVDNELDLYNYVLTVPKHKRLNRPLIGFQKHPSLVSAYPAASTSVRSSMGGSAPMAAATAATAGVTMAAAAAVPTAASVSAVPAAPTLPPVQTQTPMSLSMADTTLQPAVSPTTTTALSSPGSQNNASAAVSPEQPATGFPPGTSHQTMPSYGTPLDVLLDFEEVTVPRVVFQCVRAVDAFGVEVEGIYRTSGNATQIQEIKRLFDRDSGAVDLLRPNKQLNDIHSVASALKLYFRELPDPLLTKEFHREFIEAAKIDDDVQRRDSIHATINKLPDSNYTTLRYLILHLYRVQEREAINRMSIGNLGIVWGPTLMATDYNNVGDMAIQGRILETILLNAYVIFDAD